MEGLTNVKAVNGGTCIEDVDAGKIGFAVQGTSMVGFRGIDGITGFS